MNKFLTTFILFLFCAASFAQSNQEYEIIINGKKEKVIIGKQYKFLSPKGDTIVYQLNEIPKDVVKDQPKLNQNTTTTATNNAKQQEKELTEIEKKKEEARQKIKTELEAKHQQPEVTQTKTATVVSETKPAVAEKKAEAVKTEKKTVTGTLAAEEKKMPEITATDYEFEKYYVTDQTVNETNITTRDTLKFLNTDLSVYSDFPCVQFGTGNSLSMCYDYVVQAYHGYDETLNAKYTSRYRVCQVGNWDAKKKRAEVTIDTMNGRKKLNYKIVQLDAQNLVLVKN